MNPTLAQSVASMVGSTKPVMTLRKLVELVGPEFMDVPLSVWVRDAHRNIEVCAAPTSAWGLPRESANPHTGEPGRLAIEVRLDGARLVRKATGSQA